MKPHLPLIVLCFLSMQLTAQIKNTYSFAQGDTTQIVITWDAWAETGDPILGCNVYRYEDQTNPINNELLTSNDSTYHFIDTAGLNPYVPPKYIIKAVRDNDTLEVDYAHAFSSIEFITSDSSVLMVLIPWNPDSCCMGVNTYVDGLQIGFYTYQTPYTISIPAGFFPYIFYGDYDVELRFLYVDFLIYSDIKLTNEFMDYLVTTVGVPTIPEADMNFSVYPNPLTEVSTINIYLPEPSNTLLALYDIGGRKVKTLHQGSLSSGRHTFELERGQLPQGFYFLKLNSEFGNIARKIIVY